MSDPSYLTVAVEGVVDAAVAERLIAAAGLHLARAPIITNGKGRLDRQLPGFNRAARYSRWLVLRDLDRDESCAAALCTRLLPERTVGLAFRIAVESIESWLLADRASIAAFLRVPGRVLPNDPESLDDPKAALIDLARQSSSAQVRSQLLPPAGSSTRVGPGYTSALSGFALTHWSPEAAASRAPSLRRALARLRQRGVR